MVEIDRGGSVTFHGPGQIVAYPIVDLRQRGRDVHQYLRDLEAVLIRTLAAYGLEGEARGGLTGAWVGSSKVASIGVNVRHWITTHGLALNVATDLSYFAAIKPCGLGSEENNYDGRAFGACVGPERSRVRTATRILRRIRLRTGRGRAQCLSGLHWPFQAKVLDSKAATNRPERSSQTGPIIPKNKR